MSYNIPKLINEYREKFPDEPKQWRKGPRLGVYDIQQLYKMSNGDAFEMIDNSLLAGFMIGYKYAKNQKKKI